MVLFKSLVSSFVSSTCIFRFSSYRKVIFNRPHKWYNLPLLWRLYALAFCEASWRGYSSHESSSFLLRLLCQSIPMHVCVGVNTITHKQSCVYCTHHLIRIHTHTHTCTHMITWHTHTHVHTWSPDCLPQLALGWLYWWCLGPTLSTPRESSSKYIVHITQ